MIKKVKVTSLMIIGVNSYTREWIRIKDKPIPLFEPVWNLIIFETKVDKLNGKIDVEHSDNAKCFYSFQKL